MLRRDGEDTGVLAESRSLQRFFATPLMPCPYLPGRRERKVVTELTGPDADLLYEALTESGFRRSQSLVYKPACDGCDGCVPMRVRAEQFRPARSLRRTWRRNRDLVTEERLPLATNEQFELFRRYLGSRHGGGGMAGMTFLDYRAMIEDTPVDTFVIEFRTPEGALAATALSDRMSDGYSMVYSFFDPDLHARSPGSFMILWHIARARLEHLPHVYLGYWIQDCRKMNYKERFVPLEGYAQGRWQLMFN